MEESNKFNLRILNDFSSIDLREANEIEILNYLKDSFQELEEKKIFFSIEAINNEFLDIQNQLIEIMFSIAYEEIHKKLWFLVHQLDFLIASSSLFW